MARLLELPEPFRLRRQVILFDDFLWYISPHLWTMVPAGGGAGTASVGDAANGILTMTGGNGNTDDLDNYLKSTNELIKFADDKPVAAEARCKFTEASTNAANIVLVGMADAVASNTLTAAGGGLKASFSGACIYKVDGETTWRVISSVGATRTVTLTNKTSSSSGYQTGRIEVLPLTSAVAQIRFFIDNGDGTGIEQAKDATGLPIVHTLDMTSATEMNLFVGVRNGAAANESILCDYLGAWWLR